MKKFIETFFSEFSLADQKQISSIIVTNEKYEDIVFNDLEVFLASKNRDYLAIRFLFDKVENNEDYLVELFISNSIPNLVLFSCKVPSPENFIMRIVEFCLYNKFETFYGYGFCTKERVLLDGLAAAFCLGEDSAISKIKGVVRNTFIEWQRFNNIPYIIRAIFSYNFLSENYLQKEYNGKKLEQIMTDINAKIIFQYSDFYLVAIDIPSMGFFKKKKIKLT